MDLTKLSDAEIINLVKVRNIMEIRGAGDWILDESTAACILAALKYAEKIIKELQYGYV